ncbi:flagellar biosynthesis protein FlhB [Tumebacillus algifaecis]|uniref:Flagellar biosynthetic protein FlhB n=1 Tax=Tumebacillus algifaecis TaxID=1214604 RepID=A0A223D2B4_9BACL|nr:flagellar biosynthesis protein FlhB [Tumebacillus algifaecis]ASS75635.1 flagellar biosynthesis protein FlhB [Tumebacillus algifaecis]
MIRINLQLFAGEKTEKATPKKRQDARKKGQVARSQEFGQAIVLLVGLFCLKLMSGTFLAKLVERFQVQLTSGLSYELNDQSIAPLFLDLTLTVAMLVLPISGVIMVIGGFVAYFQVGSLFTMKPLMPDIKKIDPIQGFKRIFSMRTLVELIKSLLKMTIVSVIVYLELMGDWKRVSQLGSMEVLDILHVVGSIAFSIFWKVGIAIFILALFDLFYQRFDYNKNLRMSKQEVKEEYKQTEGSPEIKGKIKERQRQMAMRRMMADVPQADVVITNPTHYAIAIKYEADQMAAPQVVAKGIDEVAQRIKKVAKEANVVMVENRPLAQTLYKTVEIGEGVPGELFQAVAEVLAYVYRLKGKV